MKKSLPFIIIIFVLLIALGGGFLLWKRGNGSNGNSNATFVANYSAAPNSNSANAPARAAEDSAAAKPNARVAAPVVLEEYGDYQCPPCGQLYPELKQLEHEYGNQLQIVFRHFPLPKIHKNAVVAAQAAEAARNQNKFWEMHDRLYRNQQEWSEVSDPKSIFTSYARQLGLNIDQFSRDLASNIVEQRILADMQRGSSLGVNGTPTVFLDANMVNYQATNLEGLRKGINMLLERKARS